MLKIFEVVDPCPPIRIVDVGAMSVGEGTEAYVALLQHPGTRVIDFEPVAAECDRLNHHHGPTHSFLPYCIGDGSNRPFHVTNFPMTSSLYEPNTALLSLFQNLENLTRVTTVEEVQTRRLDDIEELDSESTSSSSTSRVQSFWSWQARNACSTKLC